MKRLLILALLLLGTTGCSVLQPVATAPVNRYNLNQASPIRITTQPSPYTLLISTPVASPEYQNNNMIYINQQYRINQFANNEWVAPPAQMLSTLLVRSMQNSGYFHAVVATPFAGTTDLRLDTRLLALRQEFLQKPSVVRVVLNAELINNRNNKVIASKRFSQVIRTTQDNPYSGVQAANTAIKKILTKLSQFAVHYSRRGL